MTFFNGEYIDVPSKFVFIIIFLLFIISIQDCIIFKFKAIVKHENVTVYRTPVVLYTGVPKVNQQRKKNKTWLFENYTLEIIDIFTDHGV